MNRQQFQLRTRTTAFAPIALAAAVLTGSTFAADNSALIDLLQRKGVLSKDEAARVEKELGTDREGGTASKIKLSPAVTELKLCGDLRLRYQHDNRDSQLDPAPRGGDEDRSPSGSQQSRWRFRLRLNADFKLGEHWFGGVELTTAQASDTGNQTFENGFDDYGIYISKAYLGWRPNEVFTAIAGKMTSPFYTTELVWDSDITPNGLSQVIKFHELAANAEPAGFGNGKSVAAAPGERPWELTLNAGQFLFDDNAENNPDHDNATDAYLFQMQLVGSYRFGGVKATLAPGWLVYNAASVSGVQNTQPFNDSPNVSGATRHINLLLAPGDVTFKLANRKTKVFWDFAWNLEGEERAEDIYRLVSQGRSQHRSDDNLAFLAGAQFGENKKARDWSVLAYYRQAGVSSIDPNLNDSDFAASRLNTRGFKVGLSYNFTDFAIGALTYQYAWNLRDNLLGGEATGGSAIADANDVSVFQVDLNIKF